MPESVPRPSADIGEGNLVDITGLRFDLPSSILNVSSSIQSNSTTLLMATKHTIQLVLILLTYTGMVAQTKKARAARVGAVAGYAAHSRLSSQITSWNQIKPGNLATSHDSAHVHVQGI